MNGTSADEQDFVFFRNDIRIVHLADQGSLRDVQHLDAPMKMRQSCRIGRAKNAKIILFVMKGFVLNGLFHKCQYLKK